MFSLIATILNFIKSIFGVVSGEETATVAAEADVGVAVAQEQSQVQQKWWFVAIMPPMFALPFLAWTWKAVMWDKVIAPHYHIKAHTDPLVGPLAWAYGMIIGFYFMHSLVKLSNE